MGLIFSSDCYQGHAFTCHTKSAVDRLGSMLSPVIVFIFRCDHAMVGCQACICNVTGREASDWCIGSCGDHAVGNRSNHLMLLCIGLRACLCGGRHALESRCRGGYLRGSTGGLVPSVPDKDEWRGRCWLTNLRRQISWQTFHNSLMKPISPKFTDASLCRVYATMRLDKSC